MIRIFRLFRLCLLWLAMIAVPVQGMASVLQQTCGMGQEQRPQVKRAVKAPSAHKVRLAHKRGEPAKQKQGASHGDQHENANCSACFDCCVGGSAPPSAVPARVPHDLTALHLPSSILAVTGYIPDGLERPPRPFIG